MDEKNAKKNAKKPNTKSTGQSAFKKAKFQLFGLEKCQMATINSYLGEGTSHNLYVGCLCAGLTQNSTSKQRN